MKHNILFLLFIVSLIPFPLLSQAPGGVSNNLEVWLKADANIYEDAAGTDAAENGDAVENWTDLSINGYEFTLIGGTGSDPTLASNSINFNPALNLIDDGSRHLSIFGNPVTDDMSLIATFKTTQNENEADFWTAPALWGGESTGDERDYVLGIGGGNLFFKASNGNNYGAYDPENVDDNIPHIGIGTRERAVSGDLKVFTDGIETGSETSDDEPLNDTDQLGVGNSSESGDDNAKFEGQIPEAIIYSQELNSADRNKIETYLAVKYGITMGSTTNPVDYVATDGTVIWTGDATYQNNVAGIGRDDAELLNQKQSKSERPGQIVAMGLGSIATDNPSNSNTFSADLSYMLWGNDNDDDGNPEAITSEMPYWAWQRLDREWKIQETGTVGNVEVQFDLSGITVSGTTAEQFKLLVDTDGDADFTTGTIERYHASAFSSGIVSFEDVNFDDGDHFTLVTDIVAPGGVATHLTQWYKANGNVSTSGTSITSWNSETGSIDGISTQGDPELINSSINFNHAVVFDNTDGSNDAVYQDNVEASEFISSDDNALITAFFNHSGVTLAKWENNDNGGNPRIGMEVSDPNLRFDHPSDNVSDRAINSTDITEQPIIGSGIAHAGSDTLYVNGFYSDDSDGGSINTSETGRVTFGANPDGSWSSSTDIGEVIFYNDALTTTERHEIETYLAIKYGITLGNPSNLVDYIDTDGNVIWNGDATYQNDIAGIGRDDREALSQKQSKSQNPGAIITMGLGSIAASNAANSNSFSADQDYLVWGHNGRAAESRIWPEDRDTGVTENGETIEVRMKRQWKMQETGNIGNLRIRINMSNVPGVDNIAGNNDLANLRLLVDEDDNYSDGALSIAPATYNNTTDIAEFDHDFSSSDGFYFTFGSVDESVAPLPVTFGNFYVETQNNTNHLYWSTTEEVNNDKFIIQRSKDTRNWHNIGSVAGSGNTQQQSDYQYQDKGLEPGLYYYRIKQVDYDDSSSYSAVKSAEITGNKQVAWHIYPNPAQDHVNIWRSGSYNFESYKLKIFNAIGQSLSQHVIQVKNQGEQINLPEPAGQYFLIIEYGDQREVFPVMKE